MRAGKVPVVAAAYILLMFCQAELRAAIDLELRPVQSYVRVGDTLNVGLYARSDSASNQAISAMDVLLLWDASSLQLTGVLNNGPYAWLNSMFFNDSGADGLNTSFADGDAKYTALAQFGIPAQATPSGLLVTTFVFEVTSPSAESEIDIPSALGSVSITAVYGHPNVAQDVTGARLSASIVICGAFADGDMNQDGLVDGRDLPAFVEAVFRESPTASDVCHGDFSGDSAVDLEDVESFVLALLNA